MRKINADMQEQSDHDNRAYPSRTVREYTHDNSPKKSVDEIPAPNGAREIWGAYYEQIPCTYKVQIHRQAHRGHGANDMKDMNDIQESVDNGF